MDLLSVVVLVILVSQTFFFLVMVSVTVGKWEYEVLIDSQRYDLGREGKYGGQPLKWAGGREDWRVITYLVAVLQVSVMVVVPQ
jgi:hypothetical protein